MAYGLLWGPENPPWRLLYVVPIALVVGASFILQGRLTTYEPTDLPPKFLPPT